MSLALVLPGCRKSKEQLAMEHAGKIKKPGLIRVINLTGKPQTLTWGGRPLASNIPKDFGTLFQTIGAGDQKVGVEADGKQEMELPLTVTTQELYTLVLFPGGKSTFIHDAQKLPDSTQNLSSYFVDSSGKPFDGKVTITDGTNTFDIDQSTGGMLIPEGEYTLKGDGLDIAQGSKVESDSAYSLIVIKTDEGRKVAMLMRNASPFKPARAGASG
ncbi:MAG TPA: hypothetical protein VNI20_12200 [Fimbriimonadaceae bacterium]|nr:hypothetical protein [Fimbriimonadaceae bacterium]